MIKINKENETLLSLELLREVLRYEHETGLFYWIKRTSNRVKLGQTAGTVTKQGYVRIMINGCHYLAHRLAWKYEHGDFPSGEEEPFIDHINGIPSDNRIANLRVSSHGANCKNVQKKSNNTSGSNGIYRQKDESVRYGRLYVYYYWLAEWRDKNSKKKTKRFSICKLGEDGAKQAAINYRGEQIHLLELKHGVIYSPRHGL